MYKSILRTTTNVIVEMLNYATFYKVKMLHKTYLQKSSLLTSFSPVRVY